MKIRPADAVNDLPAIVDGAMAFAAHAPFANRLPRNRNIMRRAIERVLGVEGVSVLLAEQDGKVLGGLGLLIAPFLWNPDVLVCEEIFLWVHADSPPPTAFRLLRAANRLARREGATLAYFAALSNSPAKLGAVYGRMGMTPVQTNYLGEL